MYGDDITKIIHAILGRGFNKLGRWKRAQIYVDLIAYPRIHLIKIHMFLENGDTPTKNYKLSTLSMEMMANNKKVIHAIFGWGRARLHRITELGFSRGFDETL